MYILNYVLINELIQCIHHCLLLLFEILNLCLIPILGVEQLKVL